MTTMQIQDGLFLLSLVGEFFKISPNGGSCPVKPYIVRLLQHLVSTHVISFRQMNQRANPGSPHPFSVDEYGTIFSGLSERFMDFPG